jgi:hypothetical protein
MIEQSIGFHIEKCCLSFVVNTVIITNFYYRTPMTHSMPMWLRHVFLHILPRLLWMESPKLREKRAKEHELSSTMDNLEQSLIIENPFYTSKETNRETKRTRSKHRNKVGSVVTCSR